MKYLLFVFSLAALGQQSKGLVATPLAGERRVDLTWDHTQYDATPADITFDAWRITGKCVSPPPPLAKINTAPITVKQYSDLTVEVNKTYCYAVTAHRISTNLDSVYSNTAEALVSPPPDPPTGLNTTVVDVHTVVTVTTGQPGTPTRTTVRTKSK